MEKSVPPTTPEANAPAPALQQSVAEYCESQARERHERSGVPDAGADHIRFEMQANYDLLEPVDTAEHPADKPAAMTVCIPVALMGEDQATIDRVLDTVHSSQQELGQPVDVILWTNTPNTPPNSGKPGLRQRIKERRAAATAEKRYQDLRDSLQRFDGSGTRIKTALQFIPEGQGSIGKIRSDYMEAAAVDALENGYDSDHPILWLDADTTYITKNTLPLINEKVRAGDTLFVHATERFTTEWADGKPMSERDSATRAIMIDEIHRRKFAKLAAKEGKQIGYREESGLAFKIETYLKLGGVDTDLAADEASTLITNGKELLLEGQVTRWRPRAGESPRFPHHVPGVVEYLPAARIGLSARRLVDRVKTQGAYGVWRAQQSIGTEYELFSDSDHTTHDREAAPISAEDMHHILESKRGMYAHDLATKRLDEKEDRIIARMIDEAFKD